MLLRYLQLLNIVFFITNFFIRNRIMTTFSVDRHCDTEISLFNTLAEKWKVTRRY